MDADGMRPVSGDGFVRLADGSRRWGRYGAAGLLVRHAHPDAGTTSYFVARRSRHTHMGGSWAIPGGALNRDESPVDAAVREFTEETGMTPSPLLVDRIHEDDHGGWSYWTVVADAEERFPLPTTTNWETAEVRWAEEVELPGLDLLPPFRATLHRLGVLPTGPHRVGDTGPGRTFRPRQGQGPRGSGRPPR